MRSTAETTATDPDSGHLVRALGPLDATMIVIGSMIGSGIFITSAESARLLGAPGWLLLAWVMAGVLTIAGALCCAELAAMLPRAGGQYVFLREAYGPALGFLFGWTLFLVIQTGTIAAVAIAFAKFAGVFFPAVATENYLVRADPAARRLRAQPLDRAARGRRLILFLTWVNTRGLEVGRLVQNTFTFAKTAALLGAHRDRLVVRLETGERGAGGELVESVGERLVAADRAARSHHGRRARAGGHLRQGDGRAALRPVRLDERHLHRQRNPRPRPHAAARAPHRLRARGRALRARESRLRRDALVRRHRARAAEPRRGRGVAGGARRAGSDRDGGGDHGLDLRLQQRAHPRRARASITRWRGTGFSSARSARTNARHVPAAALLAQGIWASLLTLAADRPRSIRRPAPSRYGNVYTQLLEYIIAADLIFYVLLVARGAGSAPKNPELRAALSRVGLSDRAADLISIAGILIVDLVFLAPSTSGIGFLLVLTGVPVYLAWQKAVLSFPQTNNSVVISKMKTRSMILLATGMLSCWTLESQNAAATEGHFYDNQGGGTSSSNDGRATGLVEEGTAAAAIQRYDTAIRFYSAALDLRPADRWLADIYRLRGRAYLRKGEPDKALADYDHALRLPGKSGDDHYVRAQIFESKGDYRASAREYLRDY